MIDLDDELVTRDESCTICLDALSGEATARAPCCGASFCEDCLASYVALSAARGCPMCRDVDVFLTSRRPHHSAWGRASTSFELDLPFRARQQLKKVSRPRASFRWRLRDVGRSPPRRRPDTVRARKRSRAHLSHVVRLKLRRRRSSRARDRLDFSLVLLRTFLSGLNVFLCVSPRRSSPRSLELRRRRSEIRHRGRPAGFFFSLSSTAEHVPPRSTRSPAPSRSPSPSPLAALARVPAPRSPSPALPPSPSPAAPAAAPSTSSTLC